jgi:tRNA pseudouridine55 synthase
VDGILVIDKPAGITSHDVVTHARRILKTKRVGHTGTLDPFATGVLVLMIGKATRLAQFLDKDEKEYEAAIRFGYETDTGDLTGERRYVENTIQGDTVTINEVESVLPDFLGEIEQTPPMYSAKKVDGKKLYELARKGVEVARKVAKVVIYKLEIVYDREIYEPGPTIRIRVSCSAGTYIRTLAEDIGRRLGTGAHLAELRRTRAGKFNLTESITLDALGDLADPASVLQPMTNAVKHLPSIALSGERLTKTKSGLSTRLVDAEFNGGEAIQMLGPNQELVAVGLYNKSEKTVQPKIVLV